MSDEKVLTGNVEAAGWWVYPGLTMFSMRNDRVSMTVQPSVGTFGITSLNPHTEEMSDKFVKMKEENAQLVLLSIKEALEKALGGEDFELDIEPWPRNEKLITREVVEDYLGRAAEQAEGNDIPMVDVEVYLHQFNAIDEGGAEALCKHEGTFDVSGLTCLPDDTARYFGDYKGRDLSFSGVVALSDLVAECLSDFGGKLYLDSLSELSDEAAESLSKHKGELDVDLDNLPKSAAAILRKHPSFADED